MFNKNVKTIFKSDKIEMQLKLYNSDKKFQIPDFAVQIEIEMFIK